MGELDIGGQAALSFFFLFLGLKLGLTWGQGHCGKGPHQDSNLTQRGHPKKRKPGQMTQGQTGL